MQIASIFNLLYVCFSLTKEIKIKNLGHKCNSIYGKLNVKHENEKHDLKCKNDV